MVVAVLHASGILQMESLVLHFITTRVWGQNTSARKRRPHFSLYTLPEAHSTKASLSKRQRQSQAQRKTAPSHFWNHNARTRTFPAQSLYWALSNVPTKTTIITRLPIGLENKEKTVLSLYHYIFVTSAVLTVVGWHVKPWSGTVIRASLITI